MNKLRITVVEFIFGAVIANCLRKKLDRTNIMELVLVFLTSMTALK